MVGIGRHGGLKIRWLKGRTGSSPVGGTNNFGDEMDFLKRFFHNLGRRRRLLYLRNRRYYRSEFSLCCICEACLEREVDKRITITECKDGKGLFHCCYFCGESNRLNYVSQSFVFRENGYSFIDTEFKKVVLFKIVNIGGDTYLAVRGKNKTATDSSFDELDRFRVH